MACRAGQRACPRANPRVRPYAHYPEDSLIGREPEFRIQNYCYQEGQCTMCGRYNILDDTFVRELMESLQLPLFPEPRRNIAPGGHGQIVYQDHQGRHLEDAVWSLLIEPKPTGEGVRPNPKWQTFNAQSRRLNQSPLWKSRYRHKRAIIPASGFHEWVPTGGHKQVVNIRPKQGAIAFAGLYDHWEFEGVPYTSFTMITLPPHPRFAHIHPKSIPLMLKPQDFDLWLDPDFQQLDAFADLMQPHIAVDLEVVAVDSPKTLVPIAEPESIPAD